MAERLLPYEVCQPEPMAPLEPGYHELVEKAVTLLTVMPRNQLCRETIESLLSPDDPQRAGRAVDALIVAALATEDAQGRLHRIA